MPYSGKPKGFILKRERYASEYSGDRGKPFIGVYAQSHQYEEQIGRIDRIGRGKFVAYIHTPGGGSDNHKHECMTVRDGFIHLARMAAFCVNRFLHEQRHMDRTGANKLPHGASIEQIQNHMAKHNLM